MDLQNALDLLFRDYFHMVSSPSQQLIQTDIFTDPDEHYYLTFLARQDGQTVLLDQNGTCLYAAEEILPLFLPEQHEGDLASAYQIRHSDQFGIIAPDGNYLIEPEYSHIKALAISHAYVQSQRFPTGRKIGQGEMFVCSRNAPGDQSIDIYNLTGDHLFCDLSGFYPYQQHTPSAEQRFLTETLSFCIISKDQQGQTKSRLYQTEKLLQRQAVSPSWRYVPPAYYCRKPPERLLRCLLPMAHLLGEKCDLTGCEILHNLPLYPHLRESIRYS